MGEGPDDARSRAVEAHLVACLELPEDEREQALEQLCAEHPALADELRGRWRALAALGMVGGAGDAPREAFPSSLGGFRLLERLGEGGMGVVFRAEDTQLGRDVAVKLMRPEGLYFEKARERFRREVEAIAGLRHPGIVPVHAFGEEQGVPYFAMELLEGRTLAEVLERLAGRDPARLTGRDLADALGAGDARGGLFSAAWVEVCVELALQVAAALQHAHERGIVHRDVKPSNVVLGADGRARLFDFGLATSAGTERMTRTGSQLGTLHYMSPEQLRGGDVDARADVYALGVTLYELLALRPPHRGESRLELESSILGGDAPALRAANPRVPPELEHVCAKAMEPDVARRYASAAELADELRRVQRREPVRARPMGAALRLRRWTQRHPALAIGLVAAVLVFVVVPSALLWRERQHSEALATSLEKETRALDAERSARAAEQAALAEAQATVDYLERVFLQQLPSAAHGPDVRLVDAILVGADAIDVLDDHPRVKVRLLGTLGRVLLGLNANAEAVQLLERAVGEREFVDLPGPPSDLRHTLAVAHANLGQLDQAREQAALALEEYEAAGLGDSPDALAATMTLGVVSLRQGRFEEAADALRAAYEGLVAQDDGAFNAVMSGVFLVNALKQLQRRDEALAHIAELDATSRELGEPVESLRPRVLDQVAWAHEQRGDLEAAQAAYEEALDLAVRVFGPRSVDALDVSIGLAALLERRGDREAALELAHEALGLAEELHGPDSPAARVAGAQVRRLEGR